MTVFLFCSLPPVDIRFPLLIIVEMSAKDIHGARRRFFGNAHQLHVDLFHPAAALAVVAMRAGRNNVRPDVLSTQVPGCDMIDGQVTLVLPAVLAGIIVPAENLPPCQFDVRTRPMDLVLQPDD